ncbi:MAG: LegC family aminotransferase, partial [bacterium]
LDSGWLSSAGSYVTRFEEMVARRTGRRYAVATVNGTAALHTALLVAGIGVGDEVLVPSLTFIASANAVTYTGAQPVFVDVSPETWQLDPEEVSRFLDTGCELESGVPVNRTTGRRIRAIMPVHILGHPVDMDPIMDLADRYGILVIEDAAEAVGAFYKGRPVGSHGSLACFSFNGNKIITTGGGGMVVTDDAVWAQRARHLTTQAKSHPVEYEHDEVGFNYRLTNIQAAMGCAQMEVLEEYVNIKRRIADLYTSALEEVQGILPMKEAEWATGTFWMYTVLVDEYRYGMTSRDLLSRLMGKNIMARPLWQPLDQSPVFRGAHSTGCPVAAQIHRRALSIPCSVGLSAEQQGRVIQALREEGVSG